MLAHLTTFRRRVAAVLPAPRVDRRAGVPDRRRPEPMPRMRWHG